MGAMNDLREELKIADLSMNYEDDGTVEVYSFKGKQVKMTAGATSGEVLAAIRTALAE